MSRKQSQSWEIELPLVTDCDAERTRVFGSSGCYGCPWCGAPGMAASEVFDSAGWEAMDDLGRLG